MLLVNRLWLTNDFGDFFEIFFTLFVEYVSERARYFEIFDKKQIRNLFFLFNFFISSFQSLNLNFILLQLLIDKFSLNRFCQYLTVSRVVRRDFRRSRSWADIVFGSFCQTKFLKKLKYFCSKKIENSQYKATIP